MTLGYLFIRYLWYNKEQQFVMSTEKKKMGHDHEYKCFFGTQGFEVCFFPDGMISHAMKKKEKIKGEAEVKGTCMYT